MSGAAASAEGDGLLQLGSDEFLGLSEAVGDCANHSCERNCRLVFLDDAVYRFPLCSTDSGIEMTVGSATWRSAAVGPPGRSVLYQRSALERIMTADTAARREEAGVSPRLTDNSKRAQ